MARIARVVIPGYPHHIIHRGNRREKVFFNEDDKQAYLNLLIKQAKKYEIKFRAEIPGTAAIIKIDNLLKSY